MIEVSSRSSVCYYCGHAKECKVVTRRGGDNRVIQTRVIGAVDISTVQEWERIEEVWCTYCGIVYRVESVPSVLSLPEVQ